MNVRRTALSAIALTLFVATPVLAKPDTAQVAATNTHSGVAVTIPAKAVEVADGVFSLGPATDPTTGQLVEGYMILNNGRVAARGGQKGKPDNPGSGGDGESTCYAFLANGANWKTAEPYMIDTGNIDGLPDSFVRDAIAAAVGAWDSEVATSIFGGEIANTVDGVDELQPDGQNEVLFGDIDSAGTVGVTIVWGIFRGNPSQRQLVEWDQVYDDVDYDFGDASLDSSLFDFAGVAAHEVGHAAGLGHPSDSCTQETMYRFVSPGETFQRDLNTGDIAGIKALY